MNGSRDCVPAGVTLRAARPAAAPSLPLRTARPAVAPSLPLRAALLAAALCTAPVPALAAEPWAPQSALFQLGFRWASITLLATAAGIALGLFGGAFYRRRRPSIQAASGQVERHSAGHRISHWVNAAGFLLAIGTGALLTFSWLPSPFPLTLLYTLHYLGAVLILLGLGGTAVHALTTGVSRRHRLLPDRETLRGAGLELLAYAGLVGDRGILGFAGLQWPAAWRREIERAVNYQDHPPAGKYLATQRLLSYPLWALISLAVVATGLLKAMRYAYPLPAAVVRWSTIIHDCAFIAAIVMLFVHVAAVTLVRTNWPLLRSMFLGTVSLAHVRAVHGRWYEELLRELESSAEAPGAGAPGTAHPGMGGEGASR